ncbi:MAG: mannitol dehydrogenase family protein [Alphaproteobacteria bacterium]
MPTRLAALDDVTTGVRLPQYRPSRHATGIVHLGIGAFHRAHQAVYTDDALAAGGGDWRIVGVSLRSRIVADALNPQNGLYTLIERGEDAVSARVVASLSRVIAPPDAPEEAIKAMADPSTRIVSLTVTEKAYGIDRATGRVDPAHSTIAIDLGHPQAPTGVLGMLVEALRRRRARGARGVPAFTVLCCDNLPDNGGLVRAGVLDFARRVDPALADWIEAEVAFPSTMVDRITPAPTIETREEAAERIGVEDRAAVAAEAFSQWVVEEKFPAGRPAWEAGGALFVDDVAPYERMKLRMLNGAHSMLAYAGFLSGHAHVRDVMADSSLAALVGRHVKAAAATLEPLSEIDFDDYARSLLQRFRNPNIAHETYQIAMDGTEKLPQRVFEPAVHALQHGQSLRPFAFATAAWMRYSLGHDEEGKTYVLRDPRETEIVALIKEAGAQEAPAALHRLPGLFPDALQQSPSWRNEVDRAFTVMLEQGMAEAARLEAAAI